MAKKTVSKNIKRKPLKWSVKHPDGHVYVMSKPDQLFMHFGETQAELESRGWVFEPHYA